MGRKWNKRFFIIINKFKLKVKVNFTSLFEFKAKTLHTEESKKTVIYYMLCKCRILNLPPITIQFLPNNKIIIIGCTSSSSSFLNCICCTVAVHMLSLAPFRLLLLLGTTSILIKLNSLQFM